MGEILNYFLIGLMIYFLPAFIVASRDGEKKKLIILLNIFFGWTIIGWVLCFSWSCITPRINRHLNDDAEEHEKEKNKQSGRHEDGLHCCGDGIENSDQTVIPDQRADNQSRTEWILYGTKNGKKYYYEKYSIHHITPDTLRVWTKVQYSREQIRDIIQSRTNNNLATDRLDKLAAMTELVEMNYLNRSVKSMQYVLLDHEGGILGEKDCSGQNVKPIIPDSMGDILFRIVFPKKRL
ncbi:MAG: hypothetical protein CVU71_07470 [Deltaproteobacteria bacterium HGW-Deltaproteobacteria-6]|jgi:hypothetical protein|nr:MAG: hypothetical protein CVU71_07470 [Deltaproteobacteria bacterium HGW-Deltaproteobacteria-6]